jgi:hypothetical protein
MLYKYPIIIVIIVIIVILFFTGNVLAQDINSDNDVQSDKSYPHSIGTDPLLPIFNSFALVYSYDFINPFGVIIGMWYSYATTTPSIYLEYPGAVQTIAMVTGFRWYIWRGLHIEVQLLSGYNRFYEDNEEKYYHSFGIYNEYRFGYKFDFMLFDIPFFVNVQWPVGFNLFDTNRPESFKEVDKLDPIFYIFFPNLYFGVRF